MSLTELYGPYKHNQFDAELYEVERDRVLALQALLMTELRPAATTHRKQHLRPPKTTGFVLLLEDNHIDIDPLNITEDTPDELVEEKMEAVREEIRNGGNDRYFGVMARRLSPRERRLSISVLDYTVGQDRGGSTRTIHQFLWRSDSDIALGSRRTVFASSDAEIERTSMSRESTLEVIRTGDFNRSVFTETPTGNDFDILEEQVAQTVTRIRSAA